MKRIGNIYESIYSMENLYLAAQNASKGKAKQYGVQLFLKNEEEYLYQLHKMLRDKKYKTSQYSTFKVYEPKERVVYRLNFFPDRIAHHAIMQKLEPIFTAAFTADTYSCIKGRGIHGAFYNLKRALQDKQGTTYCLKRFAAKRSGGFTHEIMNEGQNIQASTNAPTKRLTRHFVLAAVICCRFHCTSIEAANLFSYNFFWEGFSSFLLKIIALNINELR